MTLATAPAAPLTEAETSPRRLTGDAPSPDPGPHPHPCPVSTAGAPRQEVAPSREPSHREPSHREASHREASHREASHQEMSPQGVEPYPVNLRLAGERVLVVGGGTVAARKVKALKRAGAQVTVVAPQAVEAIASDAAVDWQRRPYRSGEAGDYRLVVTATGNRSVNRRVAHDAGAANVFVNSADDPANCSFTLMSVMRRGDLQVTVSSNGRSPALARWLRRRLESEIDGSHSQLLELMAAVRAEAKGTFGTSEVPGWQSALDAGLLELVRAGRIHGARRLLRHHLGLPHTAAADHTQQPASTGPATGSGITLFPQESREPQHSRQSQEPRKPRPSRESQEPRESER